MKKCIFIIIAFTIFIVDSSHIYAVSDDVLYDIYIEDTIGEFRAMNIIGDMDITEDKYVTRREAFEIIYKIKNHSGDLKYADRLKFNNICGIFSDVKFESKDSNLLYSLKCSELINGRYNSGIYTADFDDYITYNELITLIIQFLRPEFNAEICEEEYLYYNQACKMKLISKTKIFDPTCLIIGEELLDNYIKAYDCIGIINRALYIPVIKEDGTTGYYIDEFIKYNPVDEE